MSPIRPSTRRSRRAVLAAGVLATFLGATLPSAWGATSTGARAIAPPGRSFVSEFDGGHAAITVSRDLRQVTRIHLGYTYKCSDGTSIDDVDAFRSVPMLADRTFKSTYDSGDIPGGALLPGVTFRYTGIIKGKRNKAGTKIVGRLRFTFVTTKQATGEKLTCDTGTVSYVALD